MEGSQGGALRNCSNGQGDYPQNWYDQGIAVDPNNPDRVFFDTLRRLVCNAHRNCLERYHLRLFRRESTSRARGPTCARVRAWLVQYFDIGHDGGVNGTTNADVVNQTTDPTWFNMDHWYQHDRVLFRRYQRQFC